MSKVAATQITGAHVLSATTLVDPQRAWMQQAACRGVDPDLFFPVGPGGPGAESTRRAKEVCGRCTVREACLAYALASGCTDGIWGGLTERERRGLRRPSVAPHRLAEPA